MIINERTARATMTDGSQPVARANAPHPNELDLRRITRLLAQRVRYRYVEPEVQAIIDGYLIVSPCCSRNIDAGGGTIDIAWLMYSAADGLWRLYHKDHAHNQWQLHSAATVLQVLIMQLNEDPSRVFWQ